MKERFVSVGTYKTKIVFADPASCLDTAEDAVLEVFDSNTRPLFTVPPGVSEVILPAGEAYKNWQSVDTVCSAALHGGLSRDSVFFGVGGGVVCDITGLSASLFMRGTGLILVPTTLLAMTDAALGGKTGFDYRGYKNILGTFYPAREIRICPAVLSSLSEREYKSGLAEVIKHAFLRDRELLSLLTAEKDAVNRRDPSILAELIDRSLGVKGWYVEQDFLERGVRTHLNLGHTFGHALESVMGFTGISHGEAVMWGINTAVNTGILLGETDKGWAEEVRDIIRLYGYGTNYQERVSSKKLIAAMAFDKKKKNGRVMFVLQHNHGDTFTASVPSSILEQVLA